MSGLGEPVLPELPPPPERLRRGFVLGILEVLIAVSLCLAVIAGILYVQRYQIPFVAQFLPTRTPIPSPTPVGTMYSNAAMGVRLYYPTGWFYEEEASVGMVAFSNSKDMLDGTAFPEDGVLMGLIRNPDFLADVNPDSPEELIQSILSQQNGLVSEKGIEIEPIQFYSVNGYPAASVIYKDAQPDLSGYVMVLVVIVTGDVPVIAVVVCPQEAWDTQHAVVDGILDTLEIQPLP
jgi:hypothetical protein